MCDMSFGNLTYHTLNMKTNGLKHVTCHWKSYISYIKYENKWIKTCDMSLEILHIIHENK